MIKTQESKRTPYAIACEVSRELGLSLSNGEAERLASFIGGFHDQEEAERGLMAAGQDRVRQLMRAA